MPNRPPTYSSDMQGPSRTKLARYETDPGNFTGESSSPSSLINNSTNNNSTNNTTNNSITHGGTHVGTILDIKISTSTNVMDISTSPIKTIIENLNVSDSFKIHDEKDECLQDEDDGGGIYDDREHYRKRMRQRSLNEESLEGRTLKGQTSFVDTDEDVAVSTRDSSSVVQKEATIRPSNVHSDLFGNTEGIFTPRNKDVRDSHPHDRNADRSRTGRRHLKRHIDENDQKISRFDSTASTTASTGGGATSSLQSMPSFGSSILGSGAKKNDGFCNGNNYSSNANNYSNGNNNNNQTTQSEEPKSAIYIPFRARNDYDGSSRHREVWSKKSKKERKEKERKSVKRKKSVKKSDSCSESSTSGRGSRGRNGTSSCSSGSGNNGSKENSTSCENSKENGRFDTIMDTSSNLLASSDLLTVNESSTSIIDCSLNKCASQFVREKFDLVHQLLIGQGFLDNCSELASNFDSISKTTFETNCFSGVWRRIGTNKFKGVLCDTESSGLCSFDDPTFATGIAVGEEYRWKNRYARFKRKVLEFRLPYGPPSTPGPCRSGNFEYGRGYNIIRKVLTPDEVAYTKATIEKSKLEEIDCYIEVSITHNADNLSLAIVDFDQGGKSSVTFSPDTGAVIKETKLQESPRRVAGSFIQPLDRNVQKFEGKIGMYIKNGLLAFFRCYANNNTTRNTMIIGDNDQPSSNIIGNDGIGNDGKNERESYYDDHWECTGYIIDFSWAGDGNYLTPCLAFRDVGKYAAEITSFGTKRPPFEPPRESKWLKEDNVWQLLNWEATG